MATKWCTVLEVAEKIFHIVLQGHLSTFQVTRSETLSLWLRYERFCLITPIQIIEWLRNDTQKQGRGSVLVFEVIYQISMSHCWKIGFGSKLGNITRPVAAIKSLRFAFCVFFIHSAAKFYFLNNICNIFSKFNSEGRTTKIYSQKYLTDIQEKLFCEDIFLTSSDLYHNLWIDTECSAPWITGTSILSANFKILDGGL